MFKKVMLLLAASLLALPLVSCAPQNTTTEQALAEGFIKTVYNVDYKSVDGDRLVEAYRKYMTKDYMDSDGTLEYIKSLATTFKNNQNVRSVETVKVVGTSKAGDGSERIGVDFVVNNVSGTDEDLALEPGKKYMIQAIITAKADANGNLQATDMPLPGTPAEYDGKTPLPDYVPGLDVNKEKDAVYGVQEKYFRVLYDVDYKTLTPKSGEALYDICTQYWRNYNTIGSDTPMTDDPSLDLPEDTGDDTAPTDTATPPSGSPTSPATPSASPAASPEPSEALTDDSPDAPGATDIPEGAEEPSGGEKEFAQIFYEDMQNQKIVDQFLQFHPVSIEPIGFGEYKATSYIVVKHAGGEGEYYADMGVVLGQSYLYMVVTDIAYENNAWKINPDDMEGYGMIFGGKFTGTFPADLPGTHPETDYVACEKAATTFITAETNIDYKAGKDKLGEHYKTLGTANLIDTLNQRGFIDQRANEFIQGQLEGKFVDFQVQGFEPGPDPAGGQKYYLEGLAMVNFTAATPEYLNKNSIVAGQPVTYMVSMLLAWRDGQWKVDDFEMQPYDDTQDDPGITDPDTAIPEGSTEPDASPGVTPTPTK